MVKPYLDHLSGAADLQTTPAAIRAGFVAAALEKNRRATPHVEQARAFKSAAAQARVPSDLWRLPRIQAGLLTAAGVSDKACKYLTPEDKREAIDGLIANYLEPAGANFVEELVFRFLLIRGDTLGGSMRNVGGFLAQVQLNRALLASLRISGASYRWSRSKSTKWESMPSDDAGIELQIRGLTWSTGSKMRTLIYNLTVPRVGNNIDLCLFNCAPEALSKESLRDSALYVGLGELKGGIDPAGADEHWKTARTALERIRRAFADSTQEPHLFFIGAAIEERMATEIWGMLDRGELENAANLTDDAQRASFTRWLYSL